MIDPASLEDLKRTIAECIHADLDVLNQLRKDIRPIKNDVRQIHPRSTTSISFVGTDGGNNQLRFDPFLVQVIRVVDSSNNEYCLEVVSPTTPIDLLDRKHLDAQGRPRTALGEMMAFLGLKSLAELSPMIRPNARGAPVSPTWVQVYRELTEWAVLFSILKKDFGSDTLIVCDGLLRSKVFARDLFLRLIQGMKQRIEDHWKKHRRQIFLAGVAKHSSVLTRYRLAMSLEDILQTKYPSYVEIPREIEEKAYIWAEFARGNDRDFESKEVNKFVGGKMFLVKFGAHSHDPVWPVDIFVEQRNEAPTILGSMLADALNGFPIPHYPRSLQKAHENAALVDFDFDVLQDEIFQGIRSSLGDEADCLDTFQLLDGDPAKLRYS